MSPSPKKEKDYAVDFVAIKLNSDTRLGHIVSCV